MTSFEQFREELSELLGHLHDPDCRPSELMYRVLGRDSAAGIGEAQLELIRLIEGLERPPSLPSSSRTRRDFEVLRDRYLLKLTQEEAAERLHMSVRSLRRAQREATHMLARLLWEHRIARETSYGQPLPPSPPAPEAEAAPDWRQQVRREMASLQAGAPNGVADVGETITYAAELESALIARYGLTLTVGSRGGNLMAAVHPAALRQVLIMAIAELARCVQSGALTIEAGVESGAAKRVCVTLRGKAQPSAALPQGTMVAEILASLGGTIEASEADGEISLQIRIPPAEEVVVLVVDDNVDMLHFYQRCTAGSRYHLIHAVQGQRTIEALAAADPDIVVLDIILPDADGWQLLAELRRHPSTRSVPVILCSIVREEELARSLGAATYLPKPVQHREFLAALEAAVSRAPATEPTE